MDHLRVAHAKAGLLATAGPFFVHVPPGRLSISEEGGFW
ncbi:hypothetical protein SXCC_00946 [Gluconacetobacter sp. SXCC-1]|nr:hypothetical protein SXCC_00946 [Gluconacetobacter sp. SXCC-1]